MIIEFADTSRAIYKSYPIEKASRVDGIYRQKQKDKFGKDKFAECPGMVDYKNLGYIVRAWDEFKVYASKQNTMAYVAGHDHNKNSPVGGNPCPLGKMSEEIPYGIDNKEIDVMQPLHFTSPWKVHADNISLLILPATYHSNINDDFMVYPGIVDYSYNFSTLNIIMAPRKEGTFTIHAGTPLVQIIPMRKEIVNAAYGPAKYAENIFVSSIKQWYRKYCMKRSRYNLIFEDEINE
jgi:hypothetical protein